MIIKRKYVVFKDLFDNDERGSLEYYRTLNLLEEHNVDFREFLKSISNKRLYEFENDNTEYKEFFDTLLEKFERLDAYYPYDNLYSLGFVKSAEIIKENFPYITIALVKPKNDYSPEDYVCVIDLEKGKYGQCKMI